jgi:hypothetical protein
MNAYHGPRMTLGNAAAARVRLMVWCLDSGTRSRPTQGEIGVCPWQRTGGAEINRGDVQRRCPV